MKAVYGAVPPDGKDYPLCMGDLWLFHTGVPEFDKVKRPASDGECPTKAVAGRLYTNNNGLPPPQAIWSYHPPPFQPFEDNAWVEVIHKTYVSDEHIGCALP